MSAIGSVMVMATGPFSPRFPSYRRAYGVQVCWSVLPTGLGDARQLAGVRHLADAHPAQAELAVDGAGPAAALAAGVGAHGELRLAPRLLDQCLLRHRLRTP